jgi:two-component system sensor histidine kinase AgrC
MNKFVSFVMYVQDRRNIYQKIFLAVTFFSIRWLAVAMAGRMDDFITKALVFRNTIAGRQWLQYGLYAGTRILDSFVSFSLQLQSV